MLLKNILNRQVVGDCEGKKIVHELNNEGCKCTLCQRVVINELKVIKHVEFRDCESQLTKGAKEEYFTKFLLHYFFLDKQPRKIRLVIPETCIFEKGAPTALILKKRQTNALKLIKNKEKLNAFEIQNFFIDGYVLHNNVKQTVLASYDEGKSKTLTNYNYREWLKNECIVLVKFISGSCQMMNPIELNNLFKSKQRAVRSDIISISTMVCAQKCNEIRIHLNINELSKSPLMQRAKNEAKIINEDVKVKDYNYVAEKEERTFEDKLKEKDIRSYLQYVSLKLLLLFSLRTEVLMQECLFKFSHDSQSGTSYLTDLQVYRRCDSSKLWGDIRREQNEQSTERLQPSPKKLTLKQSSPKQGILTQKGGRQRLLTQNRIQSGTENRKTSVGQRDRIKTAWKLEPIRPALRRI